MNVVTFADIGRYLKFYEYIKDAQDVIPDNDFINSCESFLNEKGFLTEKQVRALDNIIQNSGYLECSEADIY